MHATLDSTGGVCVNHVNIDLRSIARLPWRVERQALARRAGPYLQLPAFRPKWRAEAECRDLIPPDARTRAGQPYSARFVRTAAWTALPARARAEVMVLRDQGRADMAWEREQVLGRKGARRCTGFLPGYRERFRSKISVLLRNE